MDTTIGCPNPDEEPTAADLLELDLDLRIFDLLIDASGEADWGEAMIGRYLRLSYAAGYLEALRESHAGELCRRHGLSVPNRRSCEAA